MTASPHTLTDEMVREHLPMILRTIRYLGVHETDVNDVAQETLVQAVRAFPAFRGDSSVQTWLYGIAYNTVRNHRRSLRRDPSVSTDPGRLPEPIHSQRSASSTSLGSESEDRRYFLELLGKLREIERDVVTLVFIEGMMHEDAARVMQVSLHNLRLVLREAKEKVRRLAADREQS